VGGTHTRARKHGNGEFRDERQIDRDPIAALHAERLQHVRELIHLSIQVEIRQRAAIAWLAFPDERGLVAATAPYVPVDAIHAGVDRPADEPLGMGRLPLEHRRPLGKPLEL
jgi:hypothetical protein